MKKILLLLIITVSGYSQTLLNLKGIQHAPGANYCTVTNSLGVQTYTPCSSLSSTVVPTLQQVLASGNTTGGNNIVTSAGDAIVSEGVISSLSIQDNQGQISWSDTKNGSLTFNNTFARLLHDDSIRISAPIVKFPYSTASKIPFIDANNNFKSLEVGSGLSLSSGTLSATNTSSTTILTASTNITISGSAPNYTVSSPSQSLSISGNTISLSDSGGSVVIPTQTTGLASTTDLANKGNSQPIYSGKRRTIPFASLPAASGGYHNTVWYVPYIVSSTHTITDIGIEVTTGVAASNVRLALYSDNNGVPGSLIEESGAISSVVGGLKTYTFSSPIVLSASSQVYWMALQASLTGIGLRQGNSSVCNLYINGTGSFGPMYYQTQAFGSFPASATPVGVASQVALLISLKAQ